MRQRLIERRKALGLSQLDLANLIEASTRTVHRYETGESTPYPAARKALADALLWSLAELALALSETGTQAPLNGHQVPGWLTHYASLEQAASAVHVWQPISLPGLLQTESYACAVQSVGPDPAPPEVIAEQVAQRLSRQAVLAREPTPLRLCALIDASILQRMTGGPDVMAAQLDHLRATDALPNVEVRVAPLSDQAHAAGAGSFTLFTGEGTSTPFLACPENLVGVQYLETPTVVNGYKRLFDHLWSVSDELAH